LLIVSPMVAAESDYMLFTRLGAAAARQFAAGALHFVRVS
jgi:hypothetical protein